MRANEQDVAERARGGAAEPATVGGIGQVRRMAAITMPASEAYVSFARLATAHIGGALGLSVGRVADLRLAVDEACGQFLFGPAPRFEDFADADAADDGLGPLVDLALPLEPLELCFDRLPGKLRITVSGPVPAAAWPDRAGLGWLVLDALVSELRCEIPPDEDGVGTLAFVELLSTDDPSDDALWFDAP